jgi:hypothetical protein
MLFSMGALAAALLSYRSWTRLTPAPHRVPYEVSVQCMIVSDPRGPHAERFVMTYANSYALGALRKQTNFPPGSMIAKEKLLHASDAKPEGVAFMIKHRDGEFASSGGWEFLYTPAAGVAADYERCIACHRSGAQHDYVFSGDRR